MASMKYSYIFFDLDGTLNESGLGIKKGFHYAMEALNNPIEADEELDFVVGPPLEYSFRRLGVPEDRIKEAVTTYREYYNSKGWLEGTPYPGIKETLQTLRESGLRLAVATSKPEEISGRILEHFGMTEYFDFIAGTVPGVEKRSDKASVIEYALSRIPGVLPRQVLMVGDRHHDIEGAAANGLDSLGVLYGYGSAEELKAAGATYLASKPEDIIPFALQ